MRRQKIGVVSHDAGGAEILASYVAKRPAEWTFVLAGPALKVFERRIEAIKPLTLDEAVAQCDWLLCGTGWQSDWEWQAFKLGRQLGKRTVAFVDHWVNYRERFIRNGQEYLPDEIFVGDNMAQALARECFPKIPITLVPNPYLEDLKGELVAIHNRRNIRNMGAGRNVLFVCENISDAALRLHGDNRYFGYTEHDAIRYFFSNLHVVREQVHRVVMRPHPSDPPNKYDWVREEYGPLIVQGGDKPLLEEIAESDIVVGCASMAMVVGILARRRVICCIPPGGKPCLLPHPEIEHWALIPGKK